jgi:hypothetical protein
MTSRGKVRPVPRPWGADGGGWPRAFRCPVCGGWLVVVSPAGPAALCNACAAHARDAEPVGPETWPKPARS